ncbi:MAG TPA: PQQ-binding-like beta-propeller repeat protein [Blastocatellia bacterium]|nr:PQQ-binding-like beta-propeller repeat protein [Blastocatellia bacterium]
MTRNRVFALLTATFMLSLSLAPRSSGQSASQQVAWVNQINCTASGNNLEKTAGRDDTADAAARSQQTIAAGDAYYEFTAAQTNRLLFSGLTHAAIGTDFTEIDFAIKLNDFPAAEVRENNVYKGETPYTIGDTFRIADENGVIKYYKNGSLFYVSQKRPTYPLIADTVFVALNGRINNAMVGALSINAAAEWPMYQRDAAHTGYAVASNITASSITNLRQAWSYQTGGIVTGTPIVSGGMVYVGSWDGRMYALRESDGQVVWSLDAGQTPSNCAATYGIDSTAAIVDGRLYFGAASCALYAVNPANGNVIWRTQLADATRGWHLWSSPLVFDGKIYVGLASSCDAPCVRGTVLCLNAATGAEMWRTYTAPEGSTGAGVWSSFAADPQRRLVFVASGNFCEGTDVYGDSILAFNADNGSVVWQFKNSARNRDVDNLDFGASPVLFDVSGLPALAVGSKDGYCYAVRRDTGELMWATPVTDGSGDTGIIASAAAANGKIYFGARIAGGTGKLVALDQRFGQLVWEQPQAKPVTGAVAVANGLVFSGGADGVLRAYDAETGATVWSAQRGPMWGGVSVTADRVFVGSNDRSVYSFQLNAITPEPRATISVTSPADGDLWRKNQDYNVTWSITGSINRVDVALSRDGGTTWTPLAANVDASAGSLTVTARKPKSRQVVVRVSASNDSSVVGLSGTFRIK